MDTANDNPPSFAALLDEAMIATQSLGVHATNLGAELVGFRVMPDSPAVRGALITTLEPYQPVFERQARAIAALAKRIREDAEAEMRGGQ